VDQQGRQPSNTVKKLIGERRLPVARLVVIGRSRAHGLRGELRVTRRQTIRSGSSECRIITSRDHRDGLYGATGAARRQGDVVSFPAGCDPRKAAARFSSQLVALPRTSAAATPATCTRATGAAADDGGRTAERW
jgi:hypothetical protein